MDALQPASAIRASSDFKQELYCSERRSELLIRRAMDLLGSRHGWVQRWQTAESGATALWACKLVGCKDQRMPLRHRCAGPSCSQSSDMLRHLTRVRGSRWCLGRGRGAELRTSIWRACMMQDGRDGSFVSC